MAFSEDTKRDIVLVMSSMLFILFIVGIGISSSGNDEEPIVIS